ncbi:MAG: DUF4340 domain-containing protein [Pseudomonadota bacterium]
MKTNQLIVMGAIAAAALAGALLLKGHDDAGAGGSGASRLDGPLLPALKPAVNNIDSIRLNAGDQEITLDRGETGWSIRERDGYAAQVGRVRELLLTLAEATVLEEKTSDPENYAALGLASPTTVTITSDAFDEAQEVSIGNGARRGSATYVRRGNEAPTWLVSGSISAQADTLSWIDPIILDVPGERIQSATITHADGEVVRIEKASPQEIGYDVLDVPEGKELRYDAIANPIGSTLATLRLEEVSSAAEGSPLDDSELLTNVRYATFDGLILEVQTYDGGDAQWLTLAASVDEEQAQRFAPSSSASETDASSLAEENAAPSEGDEFATLAQVEAEADELNARLGPWVYSVGRYKIEQLTRRMDDLVQDPPPTPDAS